MMCTELSSAGGVMPCAGFGGAVKCDARAFKGVSTCNMATTKSGLTTHAEVPPSAFVRRLQSIQAPELES